MIRVVFVLLLAACWAVAQVPNYRCKRTPSLWAGDRFIVDYDTRLAIFSEIYYSSTQESIYERVYTRQEGSRPTEYEEWFDFRAQTKYNRTFGGECRSYTFSYPFKPFSVPSNATYQGRSTFGVSLPVDMFSGSFGGENEGRGRYYLFWSPVSTFGDYECVPVIESFVREGPTTPFSQRINAHVTYTNLTTTFQTPPEHCIPANTVPIRQRGGYRLPQRCEKTPPKWAGDMREADYDTGFFRVAEVTYNEVEESVYIREFEDEGPGKRPTRKEEWYDYKAERKYNQTVGGRCMSYELTSSFRPFGVPPNSVFEGRAYLGAEVAGLGLDVDQFVDELEGGVYRGSWVPAPQSEEELCVPVLETYIRRGARFSESRNIHTEFLNITVTFPSPPPHCTPAPARLVY